MPIARHTPSLWLVLGVFITATTLGTPLAARHLAAGRGAAWSAPRPPRRARFAVVSRGGDLTAARAARRIEPAPRRRAPRPGASARTENLARRARAGVTPAVAPIAPIPLRC